MTRHNASLSPLQILLSAMQRRWDAGDEGGAVDIARLAAPYLHPRRGHAAGDPAPDPDSLSDAELDHARRTAGARMALPAENPRQPR